MAAEMAPGFPTRQARRARVARTRRIEMRADPDSEARIMAAAATAGQSVSAFVLAAAVREADVVLARSDATMMSAEQFDALLDSLDVADEAPGLTTLARGPRRYTRQ